MVPFIGGAPSYWYFYLGAVGVHALLAWAWSRKLGTGNLWCATAASYGFGMIVGAKALYDLTQSVLRLRSLLSLQHYLDGGLWGGPLVVLASGWLLSMFTQDRAKTLDLVALPMPLTLCVAHVGCFLQGCCYGRPTRLPWGVSFPLDGPVAPGGVLLHPTQLYEVLVLLATHGILVRLASRAWAKGMLLGAFLGMYCAGRMIIEWFRGDSRLGYAGVSVSQVVCALTALLAWGWIGLRLRERSIRGAF